MRLILIELNHRHIMEMAAAYGGGRRVEALRERMDGSEQPVDKRFSLLTSIMIVD